MSTNFPGAVDTSATIPVEGAAIPLSTNHVTTHQNIQDAIEAIEAKVGADSSAVTTSHDYKLSEVTDKAAGKTATQTLTNKTLTSPVINVGSDATGDMYYRNAGVLTRIPVGTDNQIMKLNGTTPNWEAETTTVDASTTVKGIVEAATSAEVTAGTATGGTGAVLAVTPDALAASTPVFNGSGLTNIPKRLGTTTTDFTLISSTTETNIFSQSISGGVLSTSNYIRAIFYVQSIKTASTASSCTFRVKYGATTLISDGSFNGGGASGSIWSGRFEVVLAGAGTTSSQNAVLSYNWSPGYLGNGNVVAANFSNTTQGTSAEDSTAAKTFTVSAQMSANSLNDSLVIALVTVESIS